MPEESNIEQRDHWDATYKQDSNFFGEETSELAINALKMFEKNSSREVLELGCGQGRDTIYFLKNNLNVIAMDYPPTCINQVMEKAKALNFDNRIILKVADVRKGIPLPNESVDAIYSHMFFTMELSLKELAYIFQECLRVLRPNGLNIYSVRNDHDPHFGKGKLKGEDMWQNPMGFVVHFFSEDKIRRLANGYEILGIREFEDTSPPFTKKLYEVVLKKAK